MNTKIKQLVVAVLLCGFGAPASAAAIINVDGDGRLLGASGIDVNGVQFDVEFVDGSCADIFTECGAAAGTGFAFTDDDSANAASLALFDQVFVPVYFFGEPEVTSIVGCSNWLDCLIVTAFGTSDSNVLGRAVLLSNDPGSVISNNPFSRGVAESGDTFVFAVWSRVGDPIDVPEPGTLALLGLGLVGMGMRRRSHKLQQGNKTHSEVQS
jgi:hypothetical protein